MAFDEQLAQRVGDLLAEVPDVSERRMFGGLAFLVSGHMACGVVGSDLMLRLGEAGADEALELPHVRPMDFTGRPMSTMVYVGSEGIVDDSSLNQWVERSVQYAQSLPAKT
jgi:TfoX/Sxy family transcriptional regulator of competence genes